MNWLTATRIGYVFGIILTGLGTSYAGPVGTDSADPLVAIDLNRHSIIADIVQGFQAELARTAPGREVEESAKLHAKLSKLRADQLLAVSLASKNGSIANILDDADLLATTATAPKAYGDTNRDLMYTPIAPCRLVDTRGFGAPIQGGAYSPNTRRSYAPNGLCSVPTSNVASLMISVTTQNLTPSSGGYLTILSPGSPVSVANDVFNLGAEWSSLATTTMTGPAGQFDVFVNQATAHVVVDIVGYFGTAPNLTLTSRVVASSDASGVGSASCGTNEALVGGGCRCDGNRASGTNYGVVFSCRPVGNSFSGGCFDYLYSSAYGASPITVSAICLNWTNKAGQSADVAKGRPSPDLDAVITELRQMRSEMTRIQQSH